MYGIVQTSTHYSCWVRARSHRDDSHYRTFYTEHAARLWVAAKMASEHGRALDPASLLIDDTRGREGAVIESGSWFIYFCWANIVFGVSVFLYYLYRSLT